MEKLHYAVLLLIIIIIKIEELLIMDILLVKD